MKALIVDDNVAVQEIIKDILSDRGHIVRLASTVDEAVEKIRSFEPDVVLLDSQVGDEDGTHVITEVRDQMAGFDLRVILIKASGEIAPKDIPEIKGYVDKPFKSTDILDAVSHLQVSEVQAEVEESGRKKAKKKQGRTFRRKNGAVTEPLPDLSKSGIQFGISYVVFEPEPDRIYTFLSKFDPSEYNIMVITTGRAKAIKERFDYKSMEIVPLTSRGRMGSEDIHSLGSLMVRINEFVRDRERPVIVFDAFGEIIAADGLNPSLLMLQQLMTGATRTCTFAVSVDVAPLTDKARGILLHSMEEYDRD